MIARGAVKRIQQADRVRFSELALNNGDFHEAYLQSLGDLLAMADDHGRASLEPGGLKLRKCFGSGRRA